MTTEEFTGENIESQNENIIWTKTNPARCTQCHGANTNPIWETYFHWPGAYGSNDDFLTTSFVREEINRNGNYAAHGLAGRYGASQGRAIDLKPGTKDVEVDGFRAFMQSNT